MYKTYKFRIYPNDSQKELLNKSFGCSRFVYNYYLTKIKNNGYMSANACIKDYVDNLQYEYSFLKEVDSIIIRRSLFNLEDAYQRFFKLKSGYPKYKSKYSRNSYNTNAVYGKYKGREYCNIELDLINKRIKLPKIKWIKCRGYRNLTSINGRVINATISREANGKYYVSLLYDMNIEIPIIENPTSIVGIDLGIKNLMTLSDSTITPNNKYILMYEKRIKRCQRELSRKVRGSKNYYKCKQRLAELYQKLKNARIYYLHKVTKDITDNYDIITCEKLDTKSMLEKKIISKSISDVSFFEILRQLQYKSNWKGKYFYQINTHYPSSQTCSVCSNIDKKYKDLKYRTYKCDNCSNNMDRDLNASINIMFEGLKLHMKKIIS